jgi:putative sterol carrier protein
MNRVEEIFQKMELKLLERKQQLSDVGALVKFDISGKEGGKWIVDLNNESLGVRKGDDEASCTFTASDDNFVKLIKREIKPETAILTGKVKISGDFMLAMQLSKLFKE